jgi:hypothetical protein
MNQKGSNERPIIVSFLTIRKVIGILGLVLPFAVAIGALMYGNVTGILGSISDYYYSNMRDVFIGILCGMSLFLLSYFGYDWQDKIASKICGIAALGVAFFPTKLKAGTLKPCLSLIDNPDLSNIIHFTSAGLLFLAFSYFSLVLFQKTNKTQLSRQKIARNKIFRFCGINIICCMVLIGIYNLFLTGTPVKSINPVFWLEVIMLWSFGISWLVKGGAILNDK